MPKLDASLQKVQCIFLGQYSRLRGYAGMTTVHHLGLYLWYYLWEHRHHPSRGGR